MKSQYSSPNFTKNEKNNPSAILSPSFNNHGFKYFPKELITIMIKYIPKEMIGYLINYDFNWKKLYYELYNEKDVVRTYRYPKKLENEYLNGIINRVNCERNTISAGELHKMKVEDGKVYGMGDNGYGQLGIIGPYKHGPTHFYDLCSASISAISRSNVNTWTEIIKFNTNISLPKCNWYHSSVKQVACGVYHSMILLNNGKVLASGYNKYGQLGVGDIETRNIFVPTWPLCKIEYSPYFTESVELKNIRNANIWKSMKLNDKIIEIKCNGNHSMMLSESGRIYVTGDNIYTQLGFQSENDCQLSWKETKIEEKIVQIECETLKSIILSENGTVFITNKKHLRSFSGNIWTKLNITEKIIQIKCGYSHSMLLTEDGKVLVSGNNEHRQLGFIGTPFIENWEEVKISEKAIQIDCGDSYSMILLENGKLLATGHGCNAKRTYFLDNWECLEISEKVFYIKCVCNYYEIYLDNGMRCIGNEI